MLQGKRNGESFIRGNVFFESKKWSYAAFTELKCLLNKISCGERRRDLAFARHKRSGYEINLPIHKHNRSFFQIRASLTRGSSQFGRTNAFHSWTAGFWAPQSYSARNKKKDMTQNWTPTSLYLCKNQLQHLKRPFSYKSCRIYSGPWQTLVNNPSTTVVIIGDLQRNLNVEQSATSDQRLPNYKNALT